MSFFSMNRTKKTNMYIFELGRKARLVQQRERGGGRGGGGAGFYVHNAKRF